MFFRAWHRLNVFLRLAPVSPVACFCAVWTSYMFSRAWHWLHVFPRLTKVSRFCFPFSLIHSVFGFVLNGQMWLVLVFQNTLSKPLLDKKTDWNSPGYMKNTRWLTHQGAVIDSTGISEEEATSSPVLRGYSWPAALIDPHGLGQIRIHLAVKEHEYKLLTNLSYRFYFWLWE